MQHVYSGFPIHLATEQLKPPGARAGPRGVAAASLEIRVLGELTVLRDGVAVPLPPSRKTRALLAYLAIDRRKHQRERLCELFWELPDDPRGALRWSLSRIRQVLGAEAESCLKTDRNTVQLCLQSGSFDHACMRELAQADLNACPLALLESCAAQFSGPFLADLALPRCPEFEAWRAAMCDEADVFHIRLLRTLIERLGAEPERALVYAHRLRRLSPDNQFLVKEIDALARAARQSAMTQPSPRALRVAGSNLVAWEPRRDRGTETAAKSTVLALHRPNLRPRT